MGDESWYSGGRDFTMPTGFFKDDTCEQLTMSDSKQARVMQYLQDCPPVAQSEQTHALESRPRAQWNMYSSKPQLSHDIGKHRDFQMPQNANMSSPLLRVDVPSVYRPVSCEAVIMGTFASRSDIRSPTSTGTDVATTTTSVDGGAIDPLTWSQNVQYQQPPALGYAAQSQSGNSLFWPQLAQSSFSSTDSGSFAAQYSALQSRSGPETNIAWQTQPDWNHTTHCPFCHRWVAWPQHNLGMVDAGRATQTFQAIDQGISNSASNVTFPAPNDLRPTAPAIGAPACNKILRGMQYADAQGNLNSQTWSEVTSVESATSIASDSSVASTADSAESPAYFQEANASTDARGNHNGTDPGKYCNASTHNSDCHDSSEAKDDFLVQARLQGMAYKKIKEKGHFQEAESTLRGRFRCLTKAKKQRVRQPRWTEDDLHLLNDAVLKFTTDKVGSRRSPRKDGLVQKTVASNRVPWKKVAEHIANNGGSYLFGSATCRKKWDERL